MTAFFRQRDEFLDWLADRALPLFAKAGSDPAGGFYEALDHNGAPLPGLNRRVRVQARQAYSFARAEGLALGSYRANSDHGWRALIDLCSADPNTGRFYHIMNADGSVHASHQDTYDHTFVLLATAERIIRYADPEALKIEGAVQGFLESLREPTGGFAERSPSVETPRRQNPHMHLFESSLQRLEAGDSAFARQTIREVLELFQTKFWDRQTSVLREFFTTQWDHCPNSGDIIEPGHMVEWVWLLDQEGSSEIELLETLMQRARELGKHPELGLLADKVDLKTGKTSGTFRLWGQAEHIRACIVLARRTKQEYWLNEAAALLSQFRQFYLAGPIVGGWFDQLDEAGSPVSTNMPCSTLYHLMTLASELYVTR